MNFIQKAAEITNGLGRSIQNTVAAVSAVDTVSSAHPLDDPNEWARTPMYRPPSSVDIKKEQERINKISGVTLKGDPIYTLVWSGDRRYWDQFYTEWDALGRPRKEPERWPLVRYKALRDSNGKKIRDVFPPRWLILARIEKPQYEETWKRESWVYAPEIGTYKMIRPDTPPDVFYFWFATIASHSDHCCGLRRKESKMCYGRYAPPAAIHSVLRSQVKADRTAKHKAFEKVDLSTIMEMADEYTGYRYELHQLQASTEIFIENPLGLIGPAAMQAANIDTPAKARKLVSEFLDREIQQAAKKV